VWRTEIQFRRNVLREMGVQSVPELLARSGELWHYALEKWCRLCIPSADDQTRSRWLTHPFWSAVTNAGDFHTVGSVGRRWLRLSRAPSDARLVDMFIGSITSYMAKYGEMSMAWALHDVLSLCDVVLGQRAETSEIEPGQHVARKVAEKTRRFGSGRAYRVPPRIDLTADRKPRQDGLDYEDEDDGE
jgi:hypothetical protein